MITKKQLKIFEVFTKKPFEEFTRGQIKALSKEKSNNALSIAINQFKKERIISEKKVGKSGLLRLNFNNDLVFHYLALCNEERMPHLVKMCIDEIREAVERYTHFYSIAIFGSYSIGEEHKDSDLDVAVFIESKEKANLVKAALNTATMQSPIELDTHVITKHEMLQMLTNKEENLGKQIARKHLIVYNHPIFYELIFEGLRNGFHFTSLPGESKKRT